MEKKIQSRSEAHNQIESVADFLMLYRNFFLNLADKSINWEEMAIDILKEWQEKCSNFKGAVDWVDDNPEEYKEGVKTDFENISNNIKEFYMGWVLIKTEQNPKGWDDILIGIIAPVEANLRFLKRHGIGIADKSESTDVKVAQEGECKSKRGRKPDVFIKCINESHAENVSKIISKMKKCLYNENADYAIKVIASAMDLGYIRKPTYAEFKETFGIIIMEGRFSTDITNFIGTDSDFIKIFSDNDIKCKLMI